MVQLSVDVFVSVDGFAFGSRSPGYFGFHGPDLQAWIDARRPAASRADGTADVHGARRTTRRGPRRRMAPHGRHLDHCVLADPRIGRLARRDAVRG